MAGKMKLSKPQKRVIDFLIENKKGYVSPSPHYHWQALSGKENEKYARQWCYRPTLQSLVNKNILIKNEDGNYILNPDYFKNN